VVDRRDAIRQALCDALQPHSDALAFWEAGSVATGRADQYSDLDLQLLVTDGAVDKLAAVVEAVLAEIGPVIRRYELPRPTWHGSWQAFYQLQGADPLHLVDLCILERSNPNRFLEPEIHGRPTVFFDKEGQLQQPPTDAEAFAAKLAQRLEVLEQVPELMHGFVEKELLRGHPLDALSYYQGLIMNRLVEALRMRHTPWRYNFGWRYLESDLPAPLYAELQRLAFVASPDELPLKKAAALRLLRRTLAELKAIDLVDHLEVSRG
jgi:predicted nucleotidyltransferase